MSTADSANSSAVELIDEHVRQADNNLKENLLGELTKDCLISINMSEVIIFIYLNFKF